MTTKTDPPKLNDPQQNLLAWIAEGGERGRVVPGRAGSTAKVLRKRFGLIEYVPGGVTGEAPSQRLSAAGRTYQAPPAPPAAEE